MAKAQKEFNLESPHSTREILAVDNGKNYGNFSAPDGDERNIFTTRNSDKTAPHFIWRYDRSSKANKKFDDWAKNTNEGKHWAKSVYKGRG